MTEYRIKVFPDQKNESVTRARDGRLIVRVNAKREQGSANERAKFLVARFLGIQGSAVSITSGHSLPTKTIRIKS